MSFANYLSRPTSEAVGTFSVPTIDITLEPTTLDEGARISDTIAYIGNATYPVNATSVISSSATFQPAFFTQPTFNQADYLRLRLNRTTVNFTQLLDLDYLVSVNSNSKTRFDLRFAIYDESLNLIQAYDPVTYDPSNISAQPALLSQIELRGWSVEIPNQAEYGFLELSGTGVTSLGFQYANSTVINAIDNSDPSGGPVPSRSSKNIFYADWGAPTTDISDVLVDLSILQAEVAQLKIDVSQADLDISDLSGRLVALDAEKLDASGGVVQGSLIRGQFGTYPSGFQYPFAKSQGGGAVLVYEGGDVSASWNPAIAVYGTSTFPVGVGTRKIYMWAGSDSGNQQTPNWETATMEIDDNLTMGGNIQMDGNRITDLANPINPNDATNKTYVDTCGSNLQTQINGKLSLTGGAMSGQISMGGNKITSLGAPTLSTDAATKNYVDSQTNGFLPLIGGSMAGPINMTGQAITTLPAPVNSGDAATKNYVDTHASGNYLPLAGGTMTGAINMGSNGITNLPTTPLNSNDAASKAYADTKLGLTGGALTGAVTSNSNISTTGNVTCATLNYTALNPPLPPTAGIGPVLAASNNANGLVVTNLGSPVNASDSATKGYADTKLPLSGGTLTGAVSSGFNMTAFSFTATGNITTPVLNYTTLNPPIATPNLGAVLSAGNNAGGNSIANVGDLQTGTLSSTGTSIQVNASDVFQPNGGLYIPPEAGASTTGLISFYQNNKATDFDFTAGKAYLQYDLTGTIVGADYTYVLKRGYTTIYVNRAPNTGSSTLDGFITFPDPDFSWVGSKVEVLISSTGNRYNNVSFATINDAEGLMFVRPWVNKDQGSDVALTYPYGQVPSGGELDWVTIGSGSPVGGLIGLSWWNPSNGYDPGNATDVNSLIELLEATQMYTLECKSAQKSTGFGYRWYVTPVFTTAGIFAP